MPAREARQQIGRHDRAVGHRLVEDGAEIADDARAASSSDSSSSWCSVPRCAATRARVALSSNDGSEKRDREGLDARALARGQRRHRRGIDAAREEDAERHVGDEPLLAPPRCKQLPRARRPRRRARRLRGRAVDAQLPVARRRARGRRRRRRPARVAGRQLAARRARIVRGATTYSSARYSASASRSSARGTAGCSSSAVSVEANASARAVGDSSRAASCRSDRAPAAGAASRASQSAKANMPSSSSTQSSPHCRRRAGCTSVSERVPKRWPSALEPRAQLREVVDLAVEHDGAVRRRASTIGWWPPARSMIDRRRWPSMRRAVGEGAVVVGAARAHRVAHRSHGVGDRATRPTRRPTPAMPHMISS